MLIAKVPAVIAAVLFMSVSVQAMEFADPPGPISGALSSPRLTVHANPCADHSRRQINNPVALLPASVAGTKLADRPRPASLIRIQLVRVVFGDRPGRLSAEFRAVAHGTMRFEHRPGKVTNRFKATNTASAMKFENRPGPVSNRFKTLASVSKFADRRSFASSQTKIAPPVGLHVRPEAVDFCVGSIAPCGFVSFAQRPEKQDS